MKAIEGLHHITAVTSSAQDNVDFYRNILGQRLVKRTVNFDAPDTYHLYYGDDAGTPGSIVTFFAWPNTRRALRGNGTTNALAYNAPQGSLGFWQEHLKRSGVHTEAIENRFGAEVLPFDDPDGLRLELISSAEPSMLAPWTQGPIEARFALQGFHSATLWLRQVEQTAALLTEQMGYSYQGQEDNRYRFVSAQNGTIDILHRPGQRPAGFGAGSIHHIAFRVPHDQSQLEYQQKLYAAGLSVSPVRDRSYFHSIYYREPGGVLFEIATQNPGFAVDEAPQLLGEGLKLPAWVESQRPEIEKLLPPLSLKPVEKVTYAPQF